MPIQPTYPGVYVQEVPSEVRTINGVSTSVALFTGRAKSGPVNKPVLCFNFSDFERVFTSDNSFGDLSRAVRLFFLNGGSQCYVIRLAKIVASDYSKKELTADSFMATAKYPGAFGNTITLEVDYNTQTPATTFNLKIYRLINGIQSEIELWPSLSMTAGDPRNAIKLVRSQLVDLTGLGTGNARPGVNTYTLELGDGDDTPLSDTEYDNAFEEVRRQVDLFNLLILSKTIVPGDVEVVDQLSDAGKLCQEKRAFLLVDPPENWVSVETATDISTGGVNELRTKVLKNHSAVFFPKVEIKENGIPVSTSPCGAIAGLMARIDKSRGVWKASAGVEADIRGISGVVNRFSDMENGILNQRAVNTIRVFPNGIVNWGARTLDGDDDFSSEWKYIPVRRTALYIEESLYRGLKWVVFEPNDERLWGQIRLNVGAFMHNLFRQGAFQGLKKSDAYFVKCDAETTTQNDINLGIVNVWVGFAPLKPAEFVILHLQQMTGQVQI